VQEFQIGGTMHGGSAVPWFTKQIASHRIAADKGEMPQ
jgi:hypothetical protein